MWPKRNTILHLAAGWVACVRAFVSSKIQRSHLLSAVLLSPKITLTQQACGVLLVLKHVCIDMPGILLSLLAPLPSRRCAVQAARLPLPGCRNVQPIRQHTFGFLWRFGMTVWAVGQKNPMPVSSPASCTSSHWAICSGVLSGHRKIGRGEADAGGGGSREEEDL